MEIVNLKTPFLNAFNDASDPAAVEYLDKLNKVYHALAEGRLYVRFVDGDRKGSIAKCSPNSKYRAMQEPCIRYMNTDYFTKKTRYRFENDYFYVVCTWKGRRNQIQLTLPNSDVECLIGNDIETVYEVFDAKAAKTEILKNPQQKDIDGNILEVGDKVMFINISYGSRMYLQRGEITEFKVVANSSGHNVHTIITNEDGIVSKLNFPHDMVLKISGKK